MTSLVDEVVSAAIDENVSLPALLRKAKVLAVKLDVTDIDEWLQYETAGYPGSVGLDQLPSYRVLNGQPTFFNPYNGPCPLISNDPQMTGMLSIAEMRESVASLESNLDSRKSNFYMPYPNEIEHMIQRQSDLGGMKASVQISRGAVSSVLDGVRNRVLDWALELGKQGVKGEGMSFTDQDRERAAMTGNTVNNITNNIGTMNNSQLQQASDESAQAQTNVEIDYDKVKWIADKVKEDVDKFDIDGNEIIELNGHLDTVHESLRTPKPDIEVIAPALRSTKTILEGAAGNVLATRYASDIGAWLTSLSV